MEEKEGTCDAEKRKIILLECQKLLRQNQQSLRQHGLASLAS